MEKEDCILCEQLLPNDIINYIYSNKDGIIFTAVIKKIKYCPNCGKKLYDHERITYFGG